MKKFLIAITLVVFFVPCVSFAQTATPTTYSPQYIAILQQLVKLLEQELAAIQPATVPTTTAVTTNSTTATTSPSAVTTYITYNKDGTETQWSNATGEMVATPVQPPCLPPKQWVPSGDGGFCAPY